jgi:hypothetical protein
LKLRKDDVTCLQETGWGNRLFCGERGNEAETQGVFAGFPAPEIEIFEAAGAGKKVPESEPPTDRISTVLSTIFPTSRGGER